MKQTLSALLLLLLLAGSAASAAPPTPGSAQAAPTIAGCPLFPADNIWNARVDTLPRDPRSEQYVSSIGPNTGLHPDFGTVWEGAPIGIPYNVVPPDQAGAPVTFYYDDESDHQLYPIPADPLIEGGPDSSGDRHILIVEQENCLLYELFDARPTPGGWSAGSGAIFDLRSNALRPDGWTSADAAGLPILPGLVRYEEVAAGEIAHALRFTASRTRKAHVWPARHDASSQTDPGLPPMGQRFRLRADFDLSGFSPPVQVILRAMQRYGLILADNGSNWYISGAPDSRWDDDMLVGELRRVRGSDFEAVDASGLMGSPNSARVGPRAPADDFLWLPLLTGN